MHGLADVHGVGQLRFDLCQPQRGGVELLILRRDEPIDLDPHQHCFADGARKLFLHGIDRLFVDLGDVHFHSVHAVAGFQQLCLEIDESLRQRAHDVVETGPEAADRRFEVCHLHAVVFVDALFHRHRPIDHLHVDGVDSLRQDLAVLGQLARHVGAGLVDEAVQVSEALFDRARHGLVTIVHAPIEGGDGFVDVGHDRGGLLVETAAALVQFVDLRLDRSCLVLEVVTQPSADDGELGRQLRLHQ